MDDLVVAVFKWGGAAILALGGYVGRGMHSDIRKLKDESGNCKLDLANFRLDVANTYAKDTTVQLSLARLHDQMESGQDKIEASIEGLRTDIKTILTMKR